MHRAPKVMNRVLDQKQKEKDYERHRMRMVNMRSVVDVSCPSTHKRSQSTVRHSKREALQEQRFIDIEKENRILLQKMTEIMIKEPSKSLQGKRKSLNRDKRKRDLVRITLENQAILNRIVSQKAQYSNAKWEEQRIKEENLLHGLCQYPYQLGNTKTTHQRSSCKYIKPLTTRNAIYPGPQNKTFDQLEPDRVIVYKKTKQLQNNEYYLVEISKSETTMHFVVHDVQRGNSYVLEVPIKQAVRLLNDFDQQYDALASRLKLVNGHLILIDKDKEKQKVFRTTDFQKTKNYQLSKDKKNQSEQEPQSTNQEAKTNSNGLKQQKEKNQVDYQKIQLQQSLKDKKKSQQKERFKKNVLEFNSESKQEDQKERNMNRIEESYKAQENNNKQQKKNLQQNNNEKSAGQKSEGKDQLNTENPQNEEKQKNIKQKQILQDESKEEQKSTSLMIMDDNDASKCVIRLCKMNDIQYSVHQSPYFGIQFQTFQLDQCEAALIYISSVLNVKSHFYPTDIKIRAEIDQFFS